jgi:rhodanese-related sulfurtransferase
MRNLGPSELAEHLADNQPVLLDVREPWEYAICHIEGSRLMPMAQVPANLDEFDYGQEIVVICHHGIRSRQVAMYMEHMGFHNVVNLLRGIDGWAREVDREMAVY